MAVHLSTLIIVLFLAGPCLGQEEDEDFLDFTITEESPGLTFIGDIVQAARLVETYSQDVVDQLKFGFFTQPFQDDSYFMIDETTGIIRTSNNKLDRESVCTPQEETCTVQIDVGIAQPVEYLKVFTVRVEIIDINDNAPFFDPAQISIKFSESAAIGSAVSLPPARDLDSSKFGVKRYEITNLGVDNFELVTTESSDMKLRLKQKLDRERVSRYRVDVAAYDAGNPSKSGSLRIDIAVEDANDHQPEFASDQYSVNISENFPINATLFKVKAQDADTGAFGEIRYRFSSLTESLYGTHFHIAAFTGDVMLKKPLDYEKVKKYLLDILAEDGGVDSQVAQTTLTVNVQDINDNVPQITVTKLQGSDEFVVSENAPLKTFVAHISIFDADKGTNGKTNCRLNSEAFELEGKSNNRFNLVTAALLDREVQDRYQLTITCDDSGNPPLSNKKGLLVQVKDENDHVPVFTQESYHVSIEENNDEDQEIIQVEAHDRDFGDNALVTYSLDSSGVLVRFVHIDAETGMVYARSKFDYEKVKEITFEVIATDSGNPSKSSTSTVKITIIDQNDEAPMFIEPRYRFYVEEKQSGGSIVGSLVAEDKDSAPFSSFVYILQESRDAMQFEVNPSTGVLKTRGELDRESSSMYHLVVEAVDTHDHTLTSAVYVDVAVSDVNDNYPKIHYPTSENDTVYISNHVPVGYTILKVQATDDDMGQNANLSFLLTHNEDEAFMIDPMQGILETNKDFSNFATKDYTITIIVKDNGEPQKAATSRVKIVIDSAIAYDFASSGLVRQSNLTIIIAVATVSGLIMVVLIMAIVLLKAVERRRRRRRRDEDKQHQEAGDLEPGQHDPAHTANKKEVSFVLEPEDMDKQLAPMSYECVGVNRAASSSSSSHSADLVAAAQHRHPNSQLEAHLLGLLKPCDHDGGDNASASSGELSAADSGRGASEEGGDSRGHHPPPAGHSSPRHLPPSIPPRRAPRSNSQRPPARPPPSYSTFLRNSMRGGAGGERSHNAQPAQRPPKLPCKKHGHNATSTHMPAYPSQQANMPRPNINFGDLPRDSYYGRHRGRDDRDVFTDSHDSSMRSDKLDFVEGKTNKDIDFFNKKGVIV